MEEERSVGLRGGSRRETRVGGRRRRFCWLGFRGDDELALDRTRSWRQRPLARFPLLPVPRQKVHPVHPVRLLDDPTSIGTLLRRDEPLAGRFLLIGPGLRPLLRTDELVRRLGTSRGYCTEAVLDGARLDGGAEVHERGGRVVELGDESL